MEQRLKKERNRLFLRIILIITAVWLSVTVAFCSVSLIVERERIKGSELEKFSRFVQFIILSDGDFDMMGEMLQQSSVLNGDDNPATNANSQLVIEDKKRFKNVFNSAKSIGVHYNIKSGPDYFPSLFGYINYDTLRNLLSEKQYKSIEKWLNTSCDNGNYYELICTKCILKDFNIIPCELKMVLVDGSDKRFLVNDNVETYTLDTEIGDESEVYKCSDLKPNTIPKGFLLNREYGKDYISKLTKEQIKQPVVTMSTGFLEMLFYACDTLSIDDSSYDKIENDWAIMYATKISILDNCKSQLVLGSSLVFGFFLTIAFILCLMIWKTVKTQIIQEQKRRGLTDALAHDIKTPLFVISGYAYSLQEDIDSDERDLYLEKILEQTDSINNMVYKMLNLSKLDSYSMELNRSNFDLYELVNSEVNNYVKLPDDREIKINHSRDNLVNADKELIKEAVGNLIDNAAKYSLPNSVIEINIDGKSFSISNSCENLTKSDLKSIIQPYVRKDKSRTRNGNGLGLSIVNSILDLHKAKHSITLENDRLVYKFDLK